MIQLYCVTLSEENIEKEQR